MSESPIVRVEFEYEDGRVQTLTGDSAVAWIKDINNVLVGSQLRYGRSQVGDYPWVWAYKTDETRHVS